MKYPAAQSILRTKMPIVLLGSIWEYKVQPIKDFLSDSFSTLALSAKGKKVLLKPNLLSGKPPQKAVNTHPLFVRAVAEVLKDSGCSLYVGDSPGFESVERALKASGIYEALKSMDVKIAAFDRRIRKRFEGLSPFREFLLGEDPSEFDMIVNLPKLKTHTIVGLTLGIKNTFGFVPGLEKARWHLRAGKDRLLFCQILIDIHRVVAPTLTILDGIVGMDKDGPSHGRVRKLGLVAVCEDAFCLDYAVERLLGIKAPLPLTQVAKKAGLLKDFDIVNKGWKEVKDFELPQTLYTARAPLGILGRFARNLFLKKPRLRKSLCKGCHVCANACPRGAIQTEDGLPRFDYGRCIYCYCCQELCPYGAISLGS